MKTMRLNLSSTYNKQYELNGSIKPRHGRGLGACESKCIKDPSSIVENLEVS